MAPKRKRMGAARRAMEAEAEEKKSGKADGFIAREKSYAEMVEYHSEATGKTSEEPVKDAAHENGERKGVVHGAEKTDGREEKEEELEVKDIKDGTEQSIRQAHVAEEEEPDEEEILVVLELADFKNHPILDDYRSIAIEGIDSAQPTLHIGEYSLHGQMEETVGTHYFYDTKNRADGNAYRYTGQTTKKIKFTIAPPDEF